MFVYKIPYRRARAWPRPSARASKGILHTNIMYFLLQNNNYLRCKRKSTHLINFVSSNAKVVSLKLFTQLKIHLDLLFLNANLILNNRAFLISLCSKLVVSKNQKFGYF